MRENAIYTVTPPDMMLPVNGPIVTVLSSDENFVADIEKLYETLFNTVSVTCLLYTSPSPRDQRGSRMPSSA